MHLTTGRRLRAARSGPASKRGSGRTAGLVGAILLLVGGAFLAGSCGARSELPIPLPDPPPPDCTTFEDCPGHRDFCRPVGCELEEKVREQDGLRYLVGTCVELEPVDCDDDDECSIDSCDPADGTCSYRPAVLDADGDGFDGPRPGFVAGTEGACGDDCDDTSAAAYPGALEICDGVDNDCNGIIDDGATWLPLELEPFRLSNDDASPSGPGGLAWSGASWLATFDVSDGGFLAVKSRLAPNGEETDPRDEGLGVNNADSNAGPVLWIGDRYGATWTDRSTGDYQVFLALFDEAGVKVSPNVPVGSASGFSLEPGLAWTGQRFVVTWKQESAAASALYRVDAQLFDIDANPLLGAPVTLASAQLNSAQAPAVAASSLGVGIVYTIGDASDKRVAVRTFDTDLNPRSGEVFLSLDGTTDKRFTTIVANRQSYIVAWSEGDQGGAGIWGAVVDQDGGIVTEPRQIVDPGPGNHAKFSSIRALGDRALLVFSDDRDADDYELWARMFDATLQPIEDERRITFAPGVSGYQRTAFGPDGTLGVLFRDDRIGAQHTWFTRLGCAVAQP